MTAATGWRLVPVEATEEMVEAGIARAGFTQYGPVIPASMLAPIYRAMLSAAPQPGVTAEDIARLIARCDGVSWDGQTVSHEHCPEAEGDRDATSKYFRQAEAILSLISSNPTQKEQGA